MAKDSKKRDELEARFDAQMRNLEDLRGDRESMTDWPNGYSILLDPEAPAQVRGEMLNEIMQKGGRITRAIDNNGQMVQGRFAVTMLGKAGDWVGIGLLFFSKEFGELEMEAVKTRAKVIALKYGVKIDKIEPMEDPKREPDNLLSPLGIVGNWGEAASKARKFFEAGIVKYFAAANPREIQQGQFAAVPLDMAYLEHLGAACNDVYPLAGRIALYINEGRMPDKSIKKILVAVPQPKGIDYN